MLQSRKKRFWMLTQWIFWLYNLGSTDSKLIYEWSAGLMLLLFLHLFWKMAQNMLSWWWMIPIQVQQKIRGLGSAWRGDQIQTRNILRTLIMTTGQYAIIVPIINMYHFRCKLSTKNFQLCVKRYGVIHRIWKGGKSCVQSHFQYFSKPESSRCIVADQPNC